MTTSLRFQGWFQARFATDPDAYDHPRGARGWTFAVGTEPDFDRIIRFGNPVAPRSRGPQVGVRVSEVVVDGQPSGAHPLLGAQVELRDGPKFEGHNGDIAPDGREPVFPFHLVVAAGGASVEIREWLQFSDLRRPVAGPRFGRGVSSLTGPEFVQLTNSPSPSALRAARLAQLQSDLAAETVPAEQQALRERIAKLAGNGIELGSLMFKVRYAFPVPNGARGVAGPAGLLGAQDPLSRPWRFDGWMGCWDADALCGYMDGRLFIG